MWDFLLNACKHPIDYFGIIKTNTLNYSHRFDEGNGYYSFVFKTNKPISWRAGEHGVFTMPNKVINGKAWRAFSIASSESEGEIRIGTNVPAEASHFKANLMAMKPGDEITMHGPFGEFHLHRNTKQIVGIAGGIGITPFRALMHEIAHNKITNVKLDLIFAGRENYFTYESEIRNFSEHEMIDTIFVNTPDEVNATIDKLVAEFGNQAEYFISGSPGMIGAVKKTLQQKGIKKIFNDPFKGY